MKTKTKKTIKEINAAIHDGETPPIECVYDFLEHVTRETFDAIYGQLDPKLASSSIAPSSMRTTSM